MFHGKIRLYKNEDGKETEFKKEFHNEKDFNDFVENNPEFKNMADWNPVKWPSLGRFDSLLDEFRKSDRGDELFDKVEREMSELFEKAKKLLK